MNKLLKMTRWAMSAAAGFGLLFMISCSGGDDNPPPDPVVKPSISYSATAVDIATSGSVDPAVQGDPADSYEFKTPADVPAFITIDAKTGQISVAAEATVGVYNVEVVAKNSAGSGEATVEITINVNSDFDPTGKNLIWKYFMNQSDGLTFLHLDSLQAGLPGEITAAVGWPDGWPNLDPNVWNPQTLFPYLVLGGVDELLFQVPGDDACGALNPKEGGDTLLVIVNPDLTLSTICHLDQTMGTTVEIGTSTLSYANGGYIWTLDMAFQGIPISYAIGNATIGDFVDPLDAGGPRQFSAIQGTVDQFTVPTDFKDEASILTSLTQIKADVVLEILP